MSPIEEHFNHTEWLKSIAAEFARCIINDCRGKVCEHCDIIVKARAFRDACEVKHEN